MPQFYEPEQLKLLQKLEIEILEDFKRICEENHLVYFGFSGTGIGALRHKGYIPWDDDIDISMPRKDYEIFLKLVTEQMGDKYEVLNTETDINYPLATTRLMLKGTRFREHTMKGIECNWGIFLDLYALDNVADGWLAGQLQMWSAWFWGKLLILRSIPRPYLHVHGILAKLVTAACIATHYMMKWLRVPKKWLYKMRERANRRYENQKTRRIAYFCDTRPNTNMFDVEDIYPLRYLPFEDGVLPFPNHLEKLLTKMYGDYMTPPPVEKRKTHFPYELDFGPYAEGQEGVKKQRKSKRKKPLVSVCIPTYNNEEYIRETVQAVLNQTYQNLEVLVIDDHSTDGTVNIVSSIKDSRLTLIENEKNLGMAGNWNKCLQEAHGEYVKLLCADDILKPECIEWELKPLLKYPEVHLVSSDTQLVDSDGKRVGAFKRYPVRGKMDGKRLAKISLMFNNFFGAPCNNLFRKESVMKAGGFDENFPYILDFDLWTNLACHGDVYMLHKELNCFRVRSDSNTGKMIGQRQKLYTQEHRKLVEKYRESGLLSISRLEVEISVLLRQLRSNLIFVYLKLVAK